MTSSSSFDVAIVGAGAAGLMAAIVCAREGLRVIVVEKSSHVGGSAALSGGAIWAPGNHLAAQTPDGEDVRSARLYLETNLGRHLDGPLVDAFLSQAPAAMAYLGRHTAVQLQVRGYYPDYRPALPGAALGGRVLEPLPYDGRRLGHDLALVKPPLPQFTLFGGMMINGSDIQALLNAHRSWPHALHSARLLVRYAMDRIRYGRGTRLTIGNALVAGLLQTAQVSGVEIRRGVRLERLLRNAGRVTGLTCSGPGCTLDIETRLAVVLASGGFPADSGMRRQLLPHADCHRSVAATTNTGDGIRAALAIGARLEDDVVNAAFLTPVSVMRQADGSERLFPHLISDRQKPGLIAINERGRRFVNEAVSYHDFVLGMYGGAAGQAPSVPAFLVCDARFVATYGLGLVKPRTRNLAPYLRAGYLYRGRTVAELAQAMGVDAEALAQAIEAMNHAADTGHDPEFGKGSGAYERLLGDPRHRPNPCLGRLDTAPYYAVRVWPGDLGSAAGLKTDPQTRVLDANGTPIHGLYACGADMQSVMSGTYPAAGITLGPALTFGYVCARTISAGAAAADATSARTDERQPA